MALLTERRFYEKGEAPTTELHRTPLAPDVVPNLEYSFPASAGMIYGGDTTNAGHELYRKGAVGFVQVQREHYDWGRPLSA